MRPIKLIMSAFGPYAGLVPAIEFDKLSDKGLFLICGDTGAGKTMIFDAICFALYGTTSGAYRDTRNLRSQYADDKTESFVDFYFSHQSHEYHVRRYPSYERTNRNGKVVTESERVCFYCDDKAPVEGSRNVDGGKDAPGAIQQLLGIDAKQFMQIAMIAQGDFYNLLNEKTEKRTEILRTIFRTDVYKKMEFALKDIKDETGRKLDDIRRDISHDFTDVCADDDCKEAVRLKELKENVKDSKKVYNTDELCSITEKIIEYDREALSKEGEKLAEADKEQKEISDRLAIARTNNDFIDRLRKLREEKTALDGRKEEIDELIARLLRVKTASRNVYPAYSLYSHIREANIKNLQSINDGGKRLEELKEDKKQKQRKLEDASSRREEKEGLEKRADKLSEELGLYARLEELDGVKKECAKRLEALKKDREDNEKKLHDIKNEIEGYQKLEKDLSDRPDRYNSLEKEYGFLKELKDRAEKLLGEEAGRLSDMRKALEKTQNDFIAARKMYEESAGRRAEVERSLDEQRAGILAKELEEGKPCPVCGAVHHPMKALLPDEAASEEDLKEARAEEEKAAEEKNAALAKAESDKSALTVYESELGKRLKDCLKEACKYEAAGKEYDSENDISVLLSAADEMSGLLSDKAQTEKKELQTLADDCRKLEETKEKLGLAAGERKEKLLSEKESIANETAQQEKELASASASYDAIGSLSYPDRQQAEKALHDFKDLAKKIGDAIEKAEKEYADSDSLYIKTSSALETIKKKYAQEKEEEENRRKELDSLLKKHDFTDADEMLKFYEDDEKIEEEDKRINDYMKQAAALTARLDQAEKDAAGREYIDTKKLYDELASKNGLLEELRNKENTIKHRIDGNTKELERIKILAGKFTDAISEYGTAKRLYDLTTGQTGKGKITLEQYVQAAGFDGIIKAANRRLKPMSENRYELYRQEDALGKKVNTFLDLEVLDNYTGRRRPVGNLSGGESFKASLSLALGLSDTVAGSSGGVQMDALFVDEGFGTLDAQSIESALNTLVGLSSANKLVGVISHREELIDSIPAHIRVKKSRKGSSIEIAEQ